MMADTTNWRDDVATEMIRHMEAGTAPWQKPWTPGVVGKPHNPTGNHAYRGINALWLEMQGHDDPRWMTLGQANAASAQVRSGEKATRVEYWKWNEVRPVVGDDGAPVMDSNGKPRTETVKLDRPQVFYAHVFNASQIDGLEPFKAPEPTFEPVEEAEKLLAAGGIEIHNDQNDRAFYSPMEDVIRIPPETSFPTAYQYYATALHELGHATGHRDRLNREFGPFGSEGYAREELRAEMTSYMIARDLGLGHYPERHAAYCEGWLAAVRNDHNVLFRVARDAEQMATWIREPERRPALERTAQNKGKVNTMERNRDNTPPQVHSTDPASRTYLAVPFAEKDQARLLGAKWDRQQKSWYITKATDPGPFDKWHMENQPERVRETVDPAKEFADQLKRQGVLFKGPPVMDGNWHRASLETDGKGERNASYRAFLDGRPNGQIKNFKTNELTRWVATGESPGPEQLAALKTEAAANRAKRTAERRAVQANVAKASERRLADGTDTWRVGDPDGPRHGSMADDHPYLEAKGVGSYGIRADREALELMIPARDVDGKLWSLQTIEPDGLKRFSRGGRKSGLMHIIDPADKIGEPPASSPSSANPGPESLIIAEGYATAASLHEATGRPAVVAFDAGNLKPVAEALRQHYPEATLIVAADNDHKHEHTPTGNIGRDRATEAARAVGGLVVMPEFTPQQKAAGLTDWNDLARQTGPAPPRSRCPQTPSRYGNVITGMAVRVQIKAYLTPGEKRDVTALANRARITVSELVRRLVTGRDLPDTNRHLDVIALTKINADQARLGNLLRMALADEDFAHPEGLDLEQLFATLRETQAILKTRVKELKT